MCTDVTIHMSDGTLGRETNAGLAKMLCTGVIMDVSTVAEAKCAEEAGAVAVMALDCIPSAMRASGRVCRMATIPLIRAIKDAVSIPVMAKCRIGHTVEAKILQEIGVDFIDESEVLTAADNSHIDKTTFRTPFVCGARTLGDALRRLEEGATMIRTKGEAGTGDVRHAVGNFRTIGEEIDHLQEVAGVLKYDDQTQRERVINEFARRERILDTGALRQTLRQGRLPCVTFAAGGIATPADAALMMDLGADSVFVGSGIFAEGVDSPSMAAAMCAATSHHDDVEHLARAASTAGKSMRGALVDA